MNIKIIFTINTLVLFFMSIYMIYTYRKKPYNQTIKFLTYFIVLHSIGFVLFILRNQIPDFLSIIFANTLFAIGTLFLYFAIKSLLQLNIEWHGRYLIPLITYFIGFIIFTYISYNTTTRIVIYYSYCVLFLSPSAWFFWFNSSSKFKIFDRFTALFFFTIVMLFSWIIIKASFMNLHTYYFSNSNIFMMLSNIVMMLLVIWTILCVKIRIKD